MERPTTPTTLHLACRSEQLIQETAVSLGVTSTSILMATSLGRCKFFHVSSKFFFFCSMRSLRAAMIWALRLPRSSPKAPEQLQVTHVVPVWNGRAVVWFKQDGDGCTMHEPQALPSSTRTDPRGLHLDRIIRHCADGVLKTPQISSCSDSSFCDLR